VKRIAWKLSVSAAAVVTGLTPAIPSGAKAQFAPDKALSDQKPEAVLRVFISALQQCGPPQVYLLLGPTVFYSLWLQTSGMGCSPMVQNLGAVQSIKELGSVDFPAGPVKTFCSTHTNGAAAWQIGVSRWTQRVEVLVMNPIFGPCPDKTSNTSSGDSSQDVIKSKSNKIEDPPPPSGKGCLLFPDMCRNGAG
jgi:hypothetical protein